jgi:hypothetical protein
MERTITLKLPNTPARGAIARSAVIALAVRAGLAPLAADRAGASAAAAVTEIGTDEVTLVAALDGAAMVVRMRGDDGSERVLRLERTPLRPV